MAGRLDTEYVMTQVAKTQRLLWRWAQRELSQDKADGARAVAAMIKHEQLLVLMLYEQEIHVGISEEARLRILDIAEGR